MKGNLDNYQVEDIKDFFDIRIRQDISHIEKEFLRKNIGDEDREYFKRIVAHGRVILKITIPKDFDKEVLTGLKRRYEDATDSLRGKTYDKFALKTAVAIVASTSAALKSLV